ncbi:MAG TPA: hypothetical protein VFL55_21660 [Acetobacteraceae bacterium]|nr:hypothetical protein [Acetobacteraceae bacterium]
MDLPKRRRLQNTDGCNVGSRRGQLRRLTGDLLILIALALSILAATKSTAGVRAADIEVEFRAVLAVHSMSDDTMLLMDQLSKLGMP